MNRIVVFDSKRDAIWAENVAREKGFAIEVVPAPETTDVKCGMALEVLQESFEDLQAIFAQEGIAFRIYA